jgi:putative glycosyltransferase (TIGR04372 family)
VKRFLSLNHRIAYLLGKATKSLILIPNRENIGNSAEDLFFGILTAKGLNLKLIVINPMIPSCIKQFKSTDISYFELFSQFIYPKKKFHRYLLDKFFSIYYILMNIFLGPLLVQKVFLFFFKLRLLDYYLIPSLGQETIYNPNKFQRLIQSESTLTSDFYRKAASNFVIPPKTDLEFDLIRKKLSLSNTNWYVSFHIRDHYYKNDFTNIRNCDPINYMPAMNEILKAGGAVVLLGHSPFKFPITHQNFIDYRNFDSKSSFWDALVIKYSKFFVATSSGLLDIGLFFDTPILETNIVSRLHSIPLKRSDRYMFKKLFSKRLNRSLTLREFIDIDPFKIEFERDQDLDWVDNSSEDLVVAVREMLMGTSSSIQFELQHDFKELVKIRNYQALRESHIHKSPLAQMNFYRFLARHELSQSAVSAKYFEENWNSN